MFYKEFISSIEKVTSKLQDDESRELYDSRLEYYFLRNEDKLLSRITETAKKYRNTFSCWGLDQYYSRHPENREKPIVIFGAGNMGGGTIRALKLLDKNILHLVDNDSAKQGNEVLGFVVESPECLRNSDAIVIVAVSRMLQINIYYQLLGLGISETNILMHQEGGLYLDYGKQYFDVEQVRPSDEGEIFIDAGCFDGMSSVNASRWAKGKLKKVYAFEPDVNSLDLCRHNLQSLGCEFELHNVATWDSKKRLCFDIHENAGYGSKVSDIGKTFVDADSIDNILKGEKATYIKLDVEGSELKTLNGAIQTIKKWRPKLAVSLYHKPEDIIELVSFVENLDLGYKYYIRQYQTRRFETTMYAI